MRGSNQFTLKNFLRTCSKSVWFFLFLSLFGITSLLDAHSISSQMKGSDQPVHLTDDGSHPPIEKKIWNDVNNSNNNSSNNNNITPDMNLFSGVIVNGAGYSRDAEQVTEQSCFKASKKTVSKNEGAVNFDRKITLSELEDELGINMDAKVGRSLFSADANTNYLRSLEETDYSTSLIYYVALSNEVTVSINDYGEDALTNFGRKVYENNHKFFGLVCGDDYIASYKTGAFLFAGLYIEFNSHEDKKKFNASAGVNGTNLLKITSDIQSVAKHNNVSGTVKIYAYQIGGVPSRLTSILSSKAVDCNITNTQDCGITAQTLVDYSKDFAGQFENISAFEPYGIPVAYPIDRIGLNRSTSFVNKTVKQYREELAVTLKENEFYKEKLNFVMKKYPIKLDDKFLKNANLILNKADHNLDTLMDQMTGAVKCYDEPENCEETKMKIDCELRSITADDLKFLRPIKYVFFDDKFGSFYSTGVNQRSAWKLKSDHQISEASFDINGNNCTYHIQGFITVDFSGVYDPAIKKYRGKRCIMEALMCTDFILQGRVSPFFFEKYFNEKHNEIY